MRCLISLVLGCCAVVSAAPILTIDNVENESSTLSLQWDNPEREWILEQSKDCRDWAIDPNQRDYQVDETSFSHDFEAGSDAGFYRLRDVGSSNIYVVGDSISTWETWPDDLEELLGRRVFSQAIGASQSPSMVARARGVVLASPQSLVGSHEAGKVLMQWNRYVVERSMLDRYRQHWSSYVKCVSEPYRIEVYNNSTLLGLATLRKQEVSSNYAVYPNRIFCVGHDLSDGDQVTFISSDPNYPSDLSATSGYDARHFSSPDLAPSIVERRVYFVSNASEDSFEVSEFKGQTETLDLGGDFAAGVSAELGWFYEWDHAGGDYNLKWCSRTQFDDSLWLLEVSANDIPALSASSVTLPNIEILLSQMIELDRRFLIVFPPVASFALYGPGSSYRYHYYYQYVEQLKLKYPGHIVDTMSIFSYYRTEAELALLADPKKAELVWLQGEPSDDSTWNVFEDAVEGAYETWIGPGYVPLQLRSSFSDRIHLGEAGSELLAGKIAEKIQIKGW